MINNVTFNERDSKFKAGVGIAQITDTTYMVLCNEVVNPGQFALVSVNSKAKVDKITKSINHSYSGNDKPVKLLPLRGGGFAVIGTSQKSISSHFGDDIFCLIIDNKGEKVLGPHVFSDPSLNLKVNDAIEGSSGDILIIGESKDRSSNSNPYFMRVDPFLSSSLMKKISFSLTNAKGISIAENSKAELLIVGTYIDSGSDIFLIKIDEFANMISGSLKKYNEPANQFVKLIKATSPTLDEFIIGGIDSKNDSDIYLRKIDENGITLVAPTFFDLGLPGLQSAIDFNINTSTSELIIAGRKGSNGLIAKLDLSGNLIDCNSFGSSGTSFFNKIISTTDCGLMAVGAENGILFFAKTDLILSTSPCSL